MGNAIHFHSFFSFEVEELVTIILILFAALGDLLFQVVDGSSERIEYVYYPLLFRKRRNGYHVCERIGIRKARITSSLLLKFTIIPKSATSDIME